MRRLLKIIILFSVAISVLPAQPQQLDRIGIEQGLPTKKVISFAQDPEGFIWVATKRSGLLRYDGHDFTPFKWTEKIDMESVQHYIVDTKGYHYISTEKNGVIRISPNKDKYNVFQQNEFGQDLYLPSVYEDSAHNIWILSYGQGLSLLDTIHGNLKTYVHDTLNTNSLSDNKLYEIIEDKNGVLWIATEDGGISTLDPTTNKFKNYKHDPLNPNSLPGNQVYGIQLDHEGLIWASIYDRGIISFNSSNEIFQLYSNIPNDPTSLSSNLVWPIKLAGTKGLYIGTQDNGLDYLDFQSKQFTNINFDPNNDKTISGNRVISLFVDQESNLWISSDEQGINFYNSSKDNFKSIRHDPFNSKSIRSNDIMFINEDQYGHLWIGYNEAGVERINKETNEITQFSSSNNTTHSLSDDHIMSMICDQKGTVWIGTKFGGLNKINTKTLEVQQFLPSKEHPEKGPLNFWIFYMFIDATNSIWISNRGALSKFNIENNTFDHYLLDSDPSNPSTPSGSIIQSITEDSKGNIWILSVEGFEILDTNNNTFTLTEYNFFPRYYTKNIGWHSQTGTLSNFNFDTREVQHYDIEESITINDIIQGPYGSIWLSCNDGIRKFNTKTNEIQHFNKEDGLLTNLFIGGSYCSNLTGQLYFNSPNGISTFKGNEIITDTFLPKIKIISLTYYDAKSSKTEPTSYSEIEQTSVIELPHHYNIINIGFRSLSYKKSKKNLFQYRINELGDRWINLGTERNITFTNLSPQEYNLEIKGSNGDGIWNETPAILKIIITPPWYLSWWAYMSYLLFILFAIWQYFYRREQEQKRKLEEEKRVVERLKEVDRLKDVFLANTSHELRTPLNGIIGISESLRDGIAGKMSESATTNLNMIINSGKRLAHLVNDILDFSKLKNHDLSLNLTAVDLQSAVDLVVSLNLPSIGSKNVVLKNEIENNIDLVEADENRLQQILHNVIGNAIKFTHEGSITISANSDDDKIWTTIKDTGIGIPENKIESIFTSFDQVDSSIERKYGGTGLGLSITKQLVEQHGGSIDVRSKLGSGTEVSFSLIKSQVTRDDRSYIKRSIDTIIPIMEYQESTDKHDDSLVNKVSDINILVVDDEPVNRQVLSNFLKLEGYIVHLAEDGFIALEILAQREINMVLLDVMMPGISGYEVAIKIRQLYLPSILPIIMLTAKNGIDDLVTGFNAGANDYLAKPFVRKELISRIQNHLNLQKIIRTSAQFIPDAFIRSLGRQSITDVQLGDFIEKTVTVLFTDIRNYTTLSEKMTPKDNFEFVRSYVSKMGPIIQKNSGFVNQYLGDGIMCIFDKGIESALQSAIEMQNAVYEYNLIRLRKNRPAIEVGMGLCTGPLVMGIIGDDMRKDPTTISSTVNLAARFEGLTKILGAKILLGNYNSIDTIDYNKWNIRSLGLVKIRGQEKVTELLECYATDPIELKEAKFKSSNEFSSALSHLKKGDKDRCLSILKALSEICPDDRVVAYLIRHISQDLLFQNPESNESQLDFSSK